MKAGLRIGIAAIAAALAHAPGLAQNVAAPPVDEETGTVGPRELRNFELNGTVTRPAPADPAPAASEPAQTQPRPQPRAATPPGSGERPSAAPTPPAAPSDQAEPAQSVTVALPPSPSPEAGPAEPAAEPPARTFSTQPNFTRAEIPEAATMPADPTGPMWPWLLAALLLAGGIAYLAWRQHARPALAGAGGAFEPFVPTPAPQPEPLRRGPDGKPELAPDVRAPVLAGGVVGTRLKPELQIEFVPTRCIFDEEKATIEFDISVLNAGAGPARDLLLQACMFNAGATQDQEIGEWFAHPVDRGQRVQLLAPLKRLALKSAVTLTREQIKVFEAGGRRFFVPLVAFNALYRWSGGDAQTSTSYLVGRDTQAEKLAPFRIDMGPRVFRGLGAREYDLQVPN